MLWIQIPSVSLTPTPIFKSPHQTYLLNSRFINLTTSLISSFGFWHLKFPKLNFWFDSQFAPLTSLLSQKWSHPSSYSEQKSSPSLLLLFLWNSTFNQLGNPIRLTFKKSSRAWHILPLSTCAILFQAAIVSPLNYYCSGLLKVSLPLLYLPQTTPKMASRVIFLNYWSDYIIYLFKPFQWLFVSLRIKAHILRSWWFALCYFSVLCPHQQDAPIYKLKSSISFLWYSLEQYFLGKIKRSLIRAQLRDLFLFL